MFRRRRGSSDRSEAQRHLRPGTMTPASYSLSANSIPGGLSNCRAPSIATSPATSHRPSFVSAVDSLGPVSCQDNDHACKTSSDADRDRFRIATLPVADATENAAWDPANQQ